jgi:uncharacterized protein YutD
MEEIIISELEKNILTPKNIGCAYKTVEKLINSDMDEVAALMEEKRLSKTQNHLRSKTI